MAAGQPVIAVPKSERVGLDSSGKTMLSLPVVPIEPERQKWLDKLDAQERMGGSCDECPASGTGLFVLSGLNVYNRNSASKDWLSEGFEGVGTPDPFFIHLSCVRYPVVCAAGLPMILTSFVCASRATRLAGAERTAFS